MSRPLLSSHWYRVRGLKPRLRGHVQMHRHEYRGRVWYVFEDRVGGRHHRFNPAAWRVIHLMDGRRSLDDIWSLLTLAIDDDTPTQDEIIRLVGQLHASDLVHADVTPDVAELMDRRSRHERRKWMGRLGNPIALRIPLLDPDRMLTRLAAWVRPLDGPLGLAAWLAVVVPALLLLPSQWKVLTSSVGDQLLGAGNLLLLAVLFPMVKLLHEVGHGLACKLRGAEVHEAGLMFLVFYPVPYVDVSNASAFGSKWQRALVGAAGMLTELFIAALAFYLWLLLEPGLARSIAFNVAVLCSVTTLFFNANPLLRYDGYYILADLVEIPNLGTRANRFWAYIAERWIFGIRHPVRPESTVGERRWFVGYAPLAYVYRLFVSFGIAIFVARQYFLVGVAVALWTIGQGVMWPVFKGLRALATGAQFAGRGTRIRTVLASTTLAVLLMLFVVPLPYHSTVEGVLWLPERAIIRAETHGFVRRVAAEPGARVETGQPVFESIEPALAARLEAQRARVEEIEAQIDAAWLVSQARVQQIEQELRREQAALARLEEEARHLVLRAGATGTLLLDRPADWPGRYVRKGDVLAYLKTDDPPLVRAVVSQADIDAVRRSTRSVEVRLAQWPGRSWPAELRRGVPSATRQLPSAVLGQSGGGEIVIDPRDTKGLSTLESIFEFELELPPEVPRAYLGSRVWVRFAHDAEPVGLRGWRALRRAFLSFFHV